MDYDFWLRFYKNWELEALVKELGTCHLYQQDLLARAAQRQLEMEHGLRLMITSQMRETIILQAIQEIIRNGIEKTDSN